jgi:hypothetical protein
MNIHEILSTSYHRNPRVVERMIAGELLLVPMGSQGEPLKAMFSLTGVASDIWAGLREGKTGEQIAEELNDIYGVALEKAQRDVARTLNEMQQIGVVNPA